jgi:hypothetical protein
LTLASRHHVCLQGYLAAVQVRDPSLYFATLHKFFDVAATAWLGTTIALRNEYDDGLFAKCLDAFDKKVIDPLLFTVLRFGRAIEAVPPDRTGRLFRQLQGHDGAESLPLLVELLDSIALNDSSPVSSKFVYDVVSKLVPGEGSGDGMRGYHWKSVCTKLVKWDAAWGLPLLDALLSQMGRDYRLSYDSYLEPLANELVVADPSGAWQVIKNHLESTLPKWRSDILHWLKGGLATFNEKDARGAVAELPIEAIFQWIEADPEPRAVLMAHAAPRTLEDDHGGRLTRTLLRKYGQFDGVRTGISATFHSGGWTGPTSLYLKRQREKFRRWLAAGFEPEIAQWIELELECLDRNIEREEIKEERDHFV